MYRRAAMKTLAGVSCAVAAADSRDAQATTLQSKDSDVSGAATSPSRPLTNGGVEFWLTNSLHRVYPTSNAVDAQAVIGKPLLLKSGRNYKLSFQACFRNIETASAQMECAVTVADGIQAIVRRVGNVPMQHLNTFTPLAEVEGAEKIPGLCPDVLWPESIAHVGPLGTAVFWISLFVPESIDAGLKNGTVQFTMINRFGYMGWDNPQKFTVDLPFTVEVADLVVQARQNFPATIWLSADSIWEYYKVEPLSEPFWNLAENYIKNLTDHGVDVIYTPIFNIRAEQLKRPAQLLKVHKSGPEKYEFDFSDVRRWIQLAMKHGANFVEFSHFFSPPQKALRTRKKYTSERNQWVNFCGRRILRRRPRLTLNS